MTGTLKLSLIRFTYAGAAGPAGTPGAASVPARYAVKWCAQKVNDGGGWLDRRACQVETEGLLVRKLQSKGPHSGLNPFELLGAALDRMVACGLLPPERRPGAEYLAWSAVHGLAMLVLDGPLRRFTPAQTAAVGQRVLDMVEKGL